MQRTIIELALIGVIVLLIKVLRTPQVIALPSGEKIARSPFMPAT